MDAIKNANRCLPLSIANTYGWDLLCPVGITAIWNGGPDAADICIEYDADLPGGFAQSNFSDGILTLNVGYIFRTDPGWNLLVTGPLNAPKDGIAPLSGVVETSWLPFPFTMNWRFTRPGVVRFERDEPFCRVVPVVAQALEDLTPQIHPLESDQELAEQFRQWREQREFFRLNNRSGNEHTLRAGWQKFYFKGELADGRPAEAIGHATKQRMAEPVDFRPASEIVTPRTSDREPRRASFHREGFIPARSGRIFYRQVGASPAAPLLVIAGGPGLPHDYLESLAALASDRAVYFYDPLGCGKSDRPELSWSLFQQLDDLRQVRESLGLSSVHLFGHGFGALLAAEHTLREPAGIESVTLASPCLDLSRWMVDAARLRDAMPADFQNIWARAQFENNLQGEAFQATVRNFYRRYFCRNQPWPQSLVRAFSGIGHGPHSALWGPNPLFCTGSLRDYRLGERLRQLACPALFTCGAHDLATPESTAAFQCLAPRSEISVFAGSSHTPHLEEPEAYLDVLRSFLRRHDAPISTLSMVTELGDSGVNSPAASDC
jgi:proline iminopeptidase